MAPPGVPDHSDCIQSGISSPAINPVGVGGVTVMVPEAPQEPFGAVASKVILVPIKSGESTVIVLGHGVSWREKDPSC